MEGKWIQKQDAICGFNSGQLGPLPGKSCFKSIFWAVYHHPLNGDLLVRKGLNPFHYYFDDIKIRDKILLTVCLICRGDEKASLFFVKFFTAKREMLTGS